MDDILMNEKEAAAWLGVSVFTLRSYRRQGKGPNYYKLERLIRYKEKDLREYVENSKINLTR